MATSLSPSREHTYTSSRRSTIRQSHRVRRSEFYDEATEDFYDVQEYAPSSPLIEEVEPTQTLPLKDSTPNKMLSPQKHSQGTPSMPSAGKQLRDNEGLTKAIDLMQTEEDKENCPTQSLQASRNSVYDADDTCMSTFSMVPTADMTRLARLSVSPSRQSPSKASSKLAAGATPRSSQPGTPRTARPTASGPEASPTPKRSKLSVSEDMTTQLLEFTEQLNYAALHSPSRRAAALKSPVKNENANLLDFDLPPAPTPRSLPTITARELESLKAGFMSQISSLKATIDGQDATIRSLIVAKDDAERRVGETAEMLRETRGGKKALEDEKADWEKRDAEIRKILRDVKEELMEREKKCDDFASRLEDSEKQTQDAQSRATEAEIKLADLRDALPQASSGDDIETPNSAGHGTPNQKAVDKAVDKAVEHVTRELHGLYKSKHEAKVTALKKSYEKRWERNIRELEGRIEDLQRDNDELRVGRDTTMSNVLPSMQTRGTAVDASTVTTPSRTATVQERADDEAAAGQTQAEVEHANATQLAELAEKVKTLESESQAARQEAADLREELETSRAENGDLVAVVEEMLQMEPVAVDAPPADGAQPPRPASQMRMRRDSASEALQACGSEHAAGPSKGAPKVSGLARPGFGFAAGSKIGSLSRSTSGGQSSRSGIMSNIEKMGRGRAAE